MIRGIKLPLFIKDILMIALIAVIGFTIFTFTTMSISVIDVAFNSRNESKSEFVNTFDPLMGFNLAENTLTVEEIVEQIEEKKEEEKKEELKIEMATGHLGVVARALKDISNGTVKPVIETISEFAKNAGFSKSDITSHITQSRGGVKPKYIIIHYTAGADGTRGNMKGTVITVNKRDLGIDYVAGDSSVLLANPKVATHFTQHSLKWWGGGQGGGLWNGSVSANQLIGIEVQSYLNKSMKIDNPPQADKKYWSYPDKTMANLIPAVKKIMKEYDIKPRNVLRHFDVSGKSCPGIYGWNPRTGSEKCWADFKEAISDGTYHYAGTPQKEFEQWKKMEALQKGK